jgi:hypothetical protein
VGGGTELRSVFSRMLRWWWWGKSTLAGVQRGGVGWVWPHQLMEKMPELRSVLCLSMKQQQQQRLWLSGSSSTALLLLGACCC